MSTILNEKQIKPYKITRIKVPGQYTKYSMLDGSMMTTGEMVEADMLKVPLVTLRNRLSMYFSKQHKARKSKFNTVEEMCTVQKDERYVNLKAVKRNRMKSINAKRIDDGFTLFHKLMNVHT